MNSRIQREFLGAVWQLISLAAWVVGFLEDIMKECIFLADLAEPNLILGLNSNSTILKEEPMDDNPFLRSCERLVASFRVIVYIHKRWTNRLV